MNDYKKEQLGKYLANISSINRKILRLLFDLELEKNKDMKQNVENIRENPDPLNNLFFFEGILDFRSLTKILYDFNSNKKLKILINYDENDEEKKLLKSYIKNSVELRNDIWHNNIRVNNNMKYINVINDIKKAYELFKKNKSINRSELFQNSIKYLNICLEFLMK